ncbi:MAG: hypothetical protein AAGA46_05185 [Cyanobacteria bacterium P01_F01_bin.13]
MDQNGMSEAELIYWITDQPASGFYWFIYDPIIGQQILSGVVTERAF